jgi:hypothetical protein
LKGKGQAFDTIVTALTGACETEPDEDVQVAIVSALSSAAETDQRALAALRLARKSRFSSVSRAATQAIDRIQNPQGRKDPGPEAEEEPPE